MKRVWHPYTAWEDWKAGMWAIVSGSRRRRLLREAIQFTGNAKLYGSFMRRVVREWPIACEHHLSDVHSNRRAWVGHAAACLAIQCPEDITRAAWSYLSQAQQDDANAEADTAIALWEKEYRERENLGLHNEMGGEGVPGRDTGCGGPSTRVAEQSAVLSADLRSDPEERHITHALGLRAFSIGSLWSDQARGD